MPETKMYRIANLIEYDNNAPKPKVLVNEPGYRMLLFGLRAGQSIPEHSNPGVVTVHALRGHVTFYIRSVPNELRAGEILVMEASAPHRVEAHDDSALLVMATAVPVANGMNLDLREIARPERHPLVFAKLDALAVGESFRLINDHDPLPLRKQIEELRPNQTIWEYDQRGPDMFRICIRRIAPATASDIPVRTPSSVTPIEHG